MCNCLFCLTSGGAQCCAIWSAMSVLFLVFVSVVMNSPPVYVMGVNEEQAKNASRNSYVVAIMYFVTFLLSMFMYYRRLRQESSSRPKPSNQIGLGEDAADAFNVPLVESSASTSGATSASAQTRSRKSKSKGKGKGGGVTSI